MDRYAIVDILGRERRVERIVQNIARTKLNRDLQDLCQMVYEVLLTMPLDKLLDLWEHEEINFFIVRVAINQMQGSRSAYYTQIRKFSEQSDEIGDMQIDSDRDIWQI